MKMPKALALVVGGAMLLVPPLAQVELTSEPRTSIEQRLPTALLPFSLDQVLRHFNEAFGKQPFRIDERTFLYTDRENPDETVIVTVSEQESGLAVVLLTTGNYGLNYLREFFEAPFFLRSETEQFYTLLDRGSGIRSMTLNRFAFRLSVSEAGNWLVAALEFAPARTYRRELANAPPTDRLGSGQLSESESQKPAGPDASHHLPFHSLFS